MGLLKKIKHSYAKALGMDSKSKAKRRFDRAVDGSMPVYSANSVDKVRNSDPSKFVGRHPRAGELMELRAQALSFADRTWTGADLLARAISAFRGRIADGKNRPVPEGLPEEVWAMMLSVASQVEGGLITTATAAADAEEIVGDGKKDTVATLAGQYLAAYEATVVFLASRSEKDMRREAKAAQSKELHARGDLAKMRKAGYDQGSSKLLMVDQVIASLDKLGGSASREQQVDIMAEAIAKALKMNQRVAPPAT